MPHASYLMPETSMMRVFIHLQRVHHGRQQRAVAGGLLFRRDEEHVDEMIVGKLTGHNRDTLVETRVGVDSAQTGRQGRSAALGVDTLRGVADGLEMRPALLDLAD